MSTDVKTMTESPKPATLRDHLESEKFAGEIAKVLPRHVTPERMVRTAVTAMMRVPKLAKCDQTSFFNCMLQLSQLGLEPDGRHAHLIPFENRKRGVTECQLIVDYKGLVALALRSGSIAAIHCDKICDNDDFLYDCGQVLHHRINFRQPRGEAYAYVCIVTRKDGTKKCEVMTKDEVDEIRARSKSANSGAWVTDYHEMAKKTVFKRASKWIELSPEFRQAVDLDNDDYIDAVGFSRSQPQRLKGNAGLRNALLDSTAAVLSEAEAAPDDDVEEEGDADGDPETNGGEISEVEAELRQKLDTTTAPKKLEALKREILGAELEKDRKGALLDELDERYAIAMESHE